MLRYLTAGESHGKKLVAILEGMPAGLKIKTEAINRELDRRQKGYGRGKRMEIEKDTVKILSGIRKNETLGSPIAVMIDNKDAKIDELPMISQPRPGHADLSGAIKYGHRDLRNILERSSARETAARVAIGAVCRIFLREFEVDILSHVVNLGGISADVRKLSFGEIKSRAAKSEVSCADKKAEDRMIKKIDEAAENKDSLGGIFEVMIIGLPAGLGSHVHWDRKLDASMARAVMSIQAIKGVEFGLGFVAGEKPGSQVHDEICHEKDRGYYRKTNNAGGFEGGMTNGEPVVLRAVMKPISTLGKPLASVDIETKKTAKAAVERADICALAAAGTVAENVCAFEIAGAFLEKFGCDNMHAIKKNYQEYKKQALEF
jgi:chorismate synthase